MQNMQQMKLKNNAYEITASLQDRQVNLQIQDLAIGFEIADHYVYRATRMEGNRQVLYPVLENPAVEIRGESLVVRGQLAGLDLEQTLVLAQDRPFLEEFLVLTNSTSAEIALEDLGCGAQRRVTNEVGKVLDDFLQDRFQAIPFLHRPTDPAGWDNDFDIEHFLTHTGHEVRVNEWAALPFGQGFVPSSKRFSEGWAWRHGDYSLGISKFNQEAMEFSVLATEVTPSGVALRFGGIGMLENEPACLRRILPGQVIHLGVTRFATCKGGYERASHAFRLFLDEKGCRFPADFNPPVHWNELYDNPEWNLGSPGAPPGKRMTRPLTYTKELILLEAAKARDYHCEALYLDPGWDTDFATFRWGEAWLGNRKEFIQTLWKDYGLRLSLHTPLATWMSWDGRAAADWPAGALRMDSSGKLIPGSFCLGSQQYLAEAEKRLLEHCADGVTYLMFDGNWWNGGCWNPDHGHPVPYTLEAHCRASLDLAQRIHARFPRVIIEMHDMVAGGSVLRYTPVYYKYGLPGSYDDNWGFELMWQPLEDILSGRSRSLYYYNLACNVPLYLHIDLRDDNDRLVVFWWYASTCRHLGIGGTHPDPRVAEGHRQAMRRYRQLEAFYKRGDFYGISEEIHVHALPEEKAFVVNLFNLSNEERLVGGEISFAEIGLERDAWYINVQGGWFDGGRGSFHIQRRMAPWSAQVVEVRALPVI